MRQTALSELIVDTMAEGVLVWGLDARVVDCNASAERLFRRNRADLLGHRSVDFKGDMVDDAGQRVSPTQSPSAMTLATGRAVDAEIGVRLDDGTQVWLREASRPLINDAGALVGAVTTFADVTALRNLAHRLRKIVEGANVGTWEIDLRSGIVERSDMWYRLVEHAPHSVAPTLSGFRAITWPGDQHLLDAIPPTWLTGEPFLLEFRIITGGGAVKWVQVRGQATLDADAHPISLAGVLVDIDQRKKLEASVATSLEENRRLVEQLKSALVHTKRLEGLLPICAFCKSIRDGANWVRLETYVANRTDATFSHGICPDCLARYYPESSPS